MEQRDYKKVSTGRGQEIRDLLHDALKDAQYLPGKREINERLMELFPEEDLAPVRAALYEKFRQFSKTAQDKSTRFNLRQQIGEVALTTINGLEEMDRFMEPAEPEVIDLEAILDGADYGDRIGGDLQKQQDKERAEAQELLKKAGLL